MTEAASTTTTEFPLVPPDMLVTASGDGEVFAVPAEALRLFVVRMDISKMIEQESLDLSLWGSPDGQDWGSMPLLKFPQRFYTGSTQMVLDLTGKPETRFIRAHWELNRWGRVRPEPLFRFGVTARPVAPRNA